MLYEHPTKAHDTFVGIMFQWPAEILGGLFGNLILLAVFAVAFVATGYSDTRASALAAMFITWTTSILLAAIGVVSGYTFVSLSLILAALYAITGGFR